jgi:hypothetical protein
MWKNFTLKFRNWSTLLLELAVPIILLIAISQLQKVVTPTIVKETIPSNILYNPDLTSAYGFNSCGTNLVWYCPACDKATGQNLVCQPRKVAVAPNNAGNSAAATIASDFVTCKSI